MYYVYIKRLDGTSTYVKEKDFLHAKLTASHRFLFDDAVHVEISSVLPPVEGGKGVEWLK